MKKLFAILCAVASSCVILSVAAFPQEDSFSKNFKKFKDVIPGVDFFAGSRADLAPFEKPIAEARQKLAAFLGDDLAKGAIVICSKLEQKDSVNEIKVLRRGYRWVLIQLTPEASNQERLANIKSRSGGQLPPAVLERLQNPSPEMKAAAEAGMVSATARRFANAVISMSLAKDKEFRSSRLDDVGRSPLSDWLDIGLAAYASGSTNSNLRFLQDRLEEAFPLEDVLGMSRPFVAPGEGGGGMGGPITVFRPGGGAEPTTGAGAPTSERAPRPGAEAPPPGAVMMRGGPPSAGMPKEVQDRMLFDAQAATFFNYLVQKAGAEKGKELIQWDREGKDLVEFVTRPDVLGPDLEKTEREWQAWLKSQKAAGPMRIMTGAPRSPSPPQ